MDSSPWRLAAGAGVALIAVVALVAWRSADLAGGWLWALRVAALIAVVGLLAVVLGAGRQALTPRARREVVIEVPAAGAARVVAPSTAHDLSALRALLLTAVLAAAPVLVVLVLASPASGRLAVAGGELRAAPRTSTSPVVTPTTAPTSTAPTAAPSTTAPSAAPSPPAATAAPTSAAPAPAAPAPAEEQAPTAPTATTPSALPAGGSAQPCQHVVAPGQTLWGIAATQLGQDASAGQIDQRWRAVYAANIDAVGSDPDLIHPGLVLATCA